MAVKVVPFATLPVVSGTGAADIAHYDAGVAHIVAQTAAVEQHPIGVFVVRFSAGNQVNDGHSAIEFRYSQSAVGGYALP